MKLDLTDDLLHDISDIRKAIHASRYEELLFWEAIQILHLLVIIESKVHLNENQVVKILITLKELSIYGLKRHEQAEVHRYDLVKRPIHLIEAHKLCTDVLEDPQ